MRNTMIKIGQHVKFDPIRDVGGQGSWDASQSVIGTIVYINEPHKWFLVSYGEDLRAGFKFCDIGEEVTVL